MIGVPRLHPSPMQHWLTRVHRDTIGFHESTERRS
jgi:hypothetical protein